MLGVGKKPEKTPHAALVKGKATLDWDKSYDASPGSDLRKAITAAFRAEGVEDESEVEVDPVEERTRWRKQRKKKQC